MYTSLKKLTNVLIIKQEGTSRQERYMPALHANDRLMDNRNMAEMIAYMQRFSKNLLFLDPDEKEIDFTKTWEHYFKNDILFLIANVATKNVEELRTEYTELSRQFETAKSFGTFFQLSNFVFSRIRKIDEWYGLSRADQTLENDFTLYIQSYLQTELSIIREMNVYTLNELNDREKVDRFRNDIENLHGIWNIAESEDITLRERLFSGKDDQEKLTNAAHILHKTFDTIFHATEKIIRKCAGYFDEASQTKQNFHHDHNPHVALIIAFLKLFEYEKKELNKIPQRHLHFYYSDVLRIHGREAIPDQTFVIFELAKGFQNTLIKKGTQLSAGKDKKDNELIYQTEKDIVLSKTHVSSLHSIFISRNSKKEILNYYKDSFSQKVGSVFAVADQPNQFANLFGTPLPGNVVNIGFAIASPQLYLAKGERKVTLTLQSLAAFTPPEGDVQDAEYYDGQILKVLLSGEKGWIDSDVPENRVDINSIRNIGGRSIEIVFTISIRQEQAITSINPKRHEGHFATTLPVLQCILKFPPAPPANEDQSAYTSQITQLNTLQNFQVVNVSIAVQVGSIQTAASFDGVRDLILENDDSVLENKKPFFPFSSVPKVGSSFFIGCKDLFYKEINDLSLNIEWSLPEHFESYYQKYLPPYDLNQFMGTVSILDDTKWKKVFDTSVIDVTTTEPKFRSIKLRPEKLKLARNPTSPDSIPEYDDVHKDGTIRIKLNYPDFGHAVYPQLITSAVMEKALEKTSEKENQKNIREEIGSHISVKYPEDLATEKVIIQILKVDDVKKARTMLTNALSSKIEEYNIDNVYTKDYGDAFTPDDDAPGRMLVNDKNWVDKVLGFFRKIRVIDKSIHYDRDQDELDEVADNLQSKMQKKGGILMPSDSELRNLIISESKTAIRMTVEDVVDKILTNRKNGITDPASVNELLKEEFEKVNTEIARMIAEKIAIQMAVSDIPPPPYTPLINNICINYTSSSDLSLATGDKIFHLTPFGIVEKDLSQVELLGPEDAVNSGGVNHIFPERLISADTDYQGLFFMGIKDVTPNQNLSMLIQLVEGATVNDKQPPLISWFYFRNNSWVKMSADRIISDATYGFQTTGIIELSIPSDAQNTYVLFGETSFFWICAAVESSTDSFPNLIDVKSQAMLVTFMDYKKNPAHMALSLEAGKIKTLIDDIPAVKKITQPVSSFNGKLGETDREYYTRVSERLRHKSRAINNWDYERLVLEAFPSFFKVKCLNNYLNGDFAVGHITVVPISDFRNKNFAGSNMLLPKINYLDLRKIEKFISAKASPFVKVHAVNPKIEHILITCKVKFKANINKGFFLQKLNEDLITFLTPWANGDLDTVSFTAKVFSSSIINFIDSQTYVDYVTDLRMEQYTVIENGDRVFVKNEDQLTALVETDLKTGHSILVSAPKHNIGLVE